MTALRRALVLLLAVALSLLVGCAHAPAPAPAPASSRSFDLTLPALSGASVTLPAATKGKVVLLDVWATWCEPCRASLPAWMDLSARLPGLEVVTISVDDNPSEIGPFMARFGLTFPVLLDPGAVAAGRSLGLSRIPTVFLVDRSGRIRYERAGWGEGHASELEAQARVLLAE